MHQSILLTQGPICEIFAKKIRELVKNQPFWVFFCKKKFFCLIFLKISLNLYGRMDGLKFWRFPWFPANSFLCVIKRYTVYLNKKVHILWESHKSLMKSKYSLIIKCQKNWAFSQDFVTFSENLKFTLIWLHTMYSDLSIKRTHLISIQGENYLKIVKRTGCNKRTGWGKFSDVIKQAGCIRQAKTRKTIPKPKFKVKDTWYHQ